MFWKQAVIKLGLLILVVIVGYAAWGMARQAFLLRQEAAEARSRVDDLAQKRQELEKALAELDTVEVLEREAKARLNLKRPGEKVVVVVPEEEPPPPAPPATLWKKLRMYFSALLDW